MCVRVSHLHRGAVNWVRLYEVSQEPKLVLQQEVQRVTNLLFVDADDSVGHGEHLHHVRRDPEGQRSQRSVTYNLGHSKPSL